MRETRLRSLVKGLTYRALVTLIAFLIAYWATGSIDKSIQVLILYLGGSLVVYYLHERLWDKISWGRV